jgi:hypothetical protein
MIGSQQSDHLVPAAETKDKNVTQRRKGSDQHEFGLDNTWRCVLTYSMQEENCIAGEVVDAALKLHSHFARLRIVLLNLASSPCPKDQI